jgi:peptide/nickel transport system permease protein
MTATLTPAAPAAGRAKNDSRASVVALRLRRLLSAIGQILTALIPVFLLGPLFTYMLGAISGLTPAYLQLGEGATPVAIKALDQQWA